MPKETIVLHHDVFGPDSAATSLAEVRFGKNGFVEFGLRTVHAADHSDYVPTGVECPSELTRLADEFRARGDLGASNEDVRMWLKMTEDMAGRPIRGRYTSLERDQINELMRYLRRARDYAYGKDE